MNQRKKIEAIEAEGTLLCWQRCMSKKGRHVHGRAGLAEEIQKMVPLCLSDKLLLSSISTFQSFPHSNAATLNLLQPFKNQSFLCNLCHDSKY